MKPLCVLLIIVVLLFSCREENTGFKYVDATIIYTGNPDVDGCGYMLKVDTNFYKAQNLPKTYEQNELKVKVDFTFDGKGYYCGDLIYPKKTIIINSIKKY